VASRAKPSSMPPAATGTVLPFFLPLLADLHPVQGITPWHLATTLPPPSCPHAGMFASCFQAKWSRSSPVPEPTTSRDPRSCLLSTGCMGTTEGWGSPIPPPHLPLLGQVSQPLSPVRFHGRSSQVPCVSLGIRSGWCTLLWLRVAQLLSLGFPPSPVPLRSAGQVDLTPLFMCNPLHGLSLCPVKGRTLPEAGAQRTL
jgi:hypothetical protein